MFLLYHLGTCLEDILIVGLHTHKCRMYYLLVKFLHCLDNVLHQFLLTNDKKKLLTVITLMFAVLSVDFFVCIGKTIHILLQFLCVFATSSIVNSSVFLSLYVDVGYAFFGTISNIFPCLETLLKPGIYLIKLASAVLLSHKSPSYQLLWIHPLSWMCYLWTKLLKRRLTDLEFHPVEFCGLFLSAFLLEKDSTNRNSSCNFLLIVTKFYIIIPLYRVLHFFFFVEIVQHSFPANNFLLFGLWVCFCGINYVLCIFSKTIGRGLLVIKFC